MSVDALCIGHACWDLCMHVDAYPAENSKAETHLLVESGGGPAANAAWLMSRWGLSVAFAGVVGQDAYGRDAVKELRAAGVNCQLAEHRPEHSTPVSFIVVNRSTGSRTIINRKAPAPALTLDGRALIKLKPRLLLFDGHELAASQTALAAFPSAITVLDAGSLREGTSTLADKVDYLVCSERFAAQVTRETKVATQWRRCLRKLQETFGKVVVLTLGSKGAAFCDGEHLELVPPIGVKVCDTTAAGDIFHGAFAFALLKGKGLPTCLRIATAAAGLSVEKPGGRFSAPDFSTVMERVTHE